METVRVTLPSRLREGLVGRTFQPRFRWSFVPTSNPSRGREGGR